MSETSGAQLRCEVCGWKISIDEDTDSTDASCLAIDHFLKTDHTPIRKQNLTVV